MGKYFGTDGFRGEANVDLTVEHAYKVGRFLGWYYGREHKAQIVIGKDTRRSSYMFEYSLVAGLTASGADAYLLHVTTTPSVSYVVRTENFDCGIMISASHNPFYDNGIKIIGGNGQKMDAEVEAMIEGYIDDDVPKIPFATKEKIGRTVDFAAGRNRYIGYLISIPTRSFKNYRVGLDCSNGSASSVAKSVFDALGAKTYVINNEPDGTNINTNCGSTHIGKRWKQCVPRTEARSFLSRVRTNHPIWSRRYLWFHPASLPDKNNVQTGRCYSTCRQTCRHGMADRRTAAGQQRQRCGT